MKRIKSIKAFTLLELLFTLGISAIVVGLIYAVFTLVTKNLYSIKTNYSKNTEIGLLEQQLMVDFGRYNDIQYNKREGILYLKTPLDSVEYIFDDTLIIRDSDTLFHDNYESKFFLEGEASSSGVIDAVRIDFIAYKQDSFLFLYKKNDATHHMETNGY